jgi:pimeloyl-ACP methyl ester carboxylesterase
MEHLFSFRDCCVRVQERGPSPSAAAASLIFLHGRYGASESWEPVTSALSRRFRCLLVDLPGFGRSFSVLQRGLTFHELEAFLKGLVLRFAPPDGEGGGLVLVGHDIGGAVAQLGLRGLTDRLSGLVLINAGCLSEAEPHPCSGALRSWKARRKLNKLFGCSQPLSREARLQIERGWRNPGLRASRIHALEALSSTWPRQHERQEWRRLCGSVTLPVLLLWGKRDRLNPPEVGFALMQSFKQADFFEHDEAGHWPQLEAPDWVLHKMSEFLFKLERNEPGYRMAS